MNQHYSVLDIKRFSSTIWMFFILFFVLCQVKGQPRTTESSLSLLRKIELASKNQDYYSALNAYLDLYQTENSIEYASEIANLYTKIRDYRNAIKWYENIINQAEADYFESHFVLGRLHKILGNYSEAKIYLQNYLDKGQLQSLRYLAKAELQGMELLSDSSLGGTLYDAEPLSVKVNSKYAEGNPFFYENNLYYTSINLNKLVTGDLVNEVKSTLFQYDLSNRYVMPEKTENFPIGSADNIGDFFISEDDKRIFFTKINFQGSEISESVLYFSEKKEDWSKPRLLHLTGFDFVKDPVEYIVNQDTFLIFSSQQNSTGGEDLFWAQKIGSNYTRPQALPNSINTPADDCAPTVYKGKLYFASSGHPNIGGIDLFYTSLEKGDWQKPINLGPQINSTYDDTGIAFLEESNQIVLVSNRLQTNSFQSHTCCDDLFLLSPNNSEIRLNVQVYNEFDQQLEGASIILFEKKFGHLGNPIAKFSYLNAPTIYPLLKDETYVLQVQSKDYVGYEDEFTTIDFNNDQVVFEKIVLKSIKNNIGSGLIMKILNSKPFQPILLDNVHFDFESTEINIDAESELRSLVKLMIDNPELEIRIEAHTDSRGKSSYNKSLSKRRAKIIASFLRKNKINSKRIQTIGWGEEKLLNDCFDGVRCTEDEHAENRRIEFVILSGLASFIESNTPPPSYSKTITEETIDTFPKIKILNNHQDLDTIMKGEKVFGQFEFVNSGTGTLEIEIATACTCTTLDWPRKPMAPGEKGIITFYYDSNLKEIKDELDEVVVDIIANTKPIVTEAIFKIYIQSKE